MQIIIDKNVLKDQFLTPISKVIGDDDSNKGCIVNIDPNNINCLCNTKDGSVILNATLTTQTGLASTEQTHLNIFDLRKFMKLLDCIPVDQVTLNLNSNNISYASPQISFKFHLMDDGVIRKSVVNVEKINKLTFDTEFVVSNTKLEEVLRAASFTEDSNKIYLYCDNGEVFGDLTDKTKPNIDSVNVQLSKALLGNPFSHIPISLDVFRKFMGIKFQNLNVKLNTQSKILLLELNSNNCILKYVATALVK